MVYVLILWIRRAYHLFDSGRKFNNLVMIYQTDLPYQNLRAMQIFRGILKLKSTLGCPCIRLSDALDIAEQTEICCKTPPVLNSTIMHLFNDLSHY